MKQAEHQRIVLRDGRHLSVAVTGEGPDLFLLHGFSGSAESWGKVVEDLSGWRRVIRLDLLGHGRSDKPREAARYRMDEVVEDVCEVMDGRALPVDVLGYSMGARVALALATRHPRRVRRLILESGSPGLSTEAERKAREERDEALAHRLASEGIGAFVEAWRNQPVLQSLSRALGPEDFALVESQRAANDPEALAAALRGLGTGGQPSFWDSLAGNRLPTLLITGREDAKFTAIARSMAERMPEVRHVTVPGAGHRIHLERPAEWLRAVRAFLQGRGGAQDGPDAP